MIKRIDENKNINMYKSIKEASKDINTTFDAWKTQLLIAGAIINKKRAFKSKWYEVID